MGTLREHDAGLLERLLEIQRAIVEQRALHEVFDLIVAEARELLDADVVMLRLRDPGDPAQTTPTASRGASHAILAAGLRGVGGDVGALARTDGELRWASGEELDPAEWGARGLRCGVAAPVTERGAPAGSLGVGWRAERRELAPAERTAMRALAEHVSLALNHARALDDLAHQAFHDQLTGMPNRALFLDRVAHALARSRRSGGGVGVLCVDLDDFQTINDSLGHALGDTLLAEVASRLTRELRPADTLARLGADEFAVLLEDVSGTRDAARAASRLLAALAEPFDLGGRQVFVSASVGVVVGTGDGETLLRDADLAMYRAKAQGKGRYEIFETSMHDAVVERLELDVELKRGIEADELELAYQPIVSMTTGEVAGIEALVRWRHPTRGLLQPDRFIPMSEASGRIREVGLWVLRAACHQAALWRAKYPAIPGLQIGVNVSGAQLRDPGLVADVAQILEQTQLDPEGLTLEVTETVLMDDLDLAAAAKRLSELKRLGIDVAIDDFGVGHSSLRYLKGLPLDNLKIAQAFVDEIERPEDEPRILRAILDLADVFGLKPIAEGIERPEQRDRLLAMGCELGQGHLLARPLSAADADAMLLRAGLLGSAAASEEPGDPAPDVAQASRVRRAPS